METIDVIKDLCSKNKISIAQLENTLEFGNGSISKSKNMSADRVYQIAKYFNVPMEYILTGKTVEATENEISMLRQQQSILIEINKINNEIVAYYKKISDCQAKVVELKKEYSKLDTKRNVDSTPEETPAETSNSSLGSFFDDFIIDEESPFT